MIKGICSIVLMASILSISLLEGRNIGLTKEIENLREGIVCSVEKKAEKAWNAEAPVVENVALGYTDGFWVEEDETIYLLATYGCAVLEYRRGEHRVITLEEAVLPADIISYGGNLYIFEELLSELQIYTKQGELLLRSKIELQGDYVKELVLTDSGVGVLTYGNQLVMVDLETGEQHISEYTALPVVDAGEFDFTDYIATDEEGNVYSVYTKLVSDCSVISGEMTLRAISPDGECIGSCVLPMEDYTYLPGRYVCVQKNGNIYILVPTEQSVEVRKVSLKQSTESELEEISKQTKQTESRYAAKEGTSTREVSLSREEVWQRVLEMAEYKWTLKPEHTLYWYWDYNVNLPLEIAAVRKENKNKNSWSVQMTGIPYCWGGYHTLYGGVKGKTFQQALDEGFVAGNINTTSYYKYKSAGVDCSGYVGGALGFVTEKLSTGELAALGSKRKNIRNLEFMDILVWSGEHVIFFCGWLNESTMLVSEAAVREGKAVIHPKNLNEFVIDANYQMRSPW